MVLHAAIPHQCRSLSKLGDASAKSRAFTLVELLIVIAILAILLALLVPAVQAARSSATQTQCLNNLKQIGIGLQNYHDEKKHFPAARGCHPTVFTAAQGWMFHLLPYLEQGNVKAAHEPNYSAVPTETVATFLCPADPRLAALGYGTWSQGQTHAGLTWYAGVTGSNGRYPASQIDPATYGIFQVDSTGVRIRMIRDGTSNTLMVGERPPSTDFFWGWYYFADFDNLMATQDSIGQTFGLVPSSCPAPGIYRQGSTTNVCDTTHFWSQHKAGANWLFGDGSVRFLPYTAAPLTIPLATRAGEETVDLSGF